MKNIFFLLIFLSLKVASQSYYPFNKERPAYYNFNYSDEIFYQQASIKPDSFHVTGSDTLFFHSSIIDVDYGNGCNLKAHDTSFVGKTSTRDSSGNDFFFNRKNGTIYFSNSVSLNQSWIMFRFGNGDVIKATVEALDLTSVLGINDSVKTIKLQAKNAGGINISNIFNNKIFRIGKSTGFVSGYSLFHFPDDTIGFSIAGIENPSQGLTDISAAEIFNFDVGDVFDFYFESNGFACCYYEECTFLTILSKYSSTDTLQYEMARERHTKAFDWYGDSPISSLHDTLIVTYELHYIGFRVKCWLS